MIFCCRISILKAFFKIYVTKNIKLLIRLFLCGWTVLSEDCRLDYWTVLSIDIDCRLDDWTVLSVDCRLNDWVILSVDCRLDDWSALSTAKVSNLLYGPENYNRPNIHPTSLI